jgi:uncharacterized protein YqjF (DUF2071 family)
MIKACDSYLENTKTNPMSAKPFLTAEWRDLVMVNYSVEPSILSAYIPAGTELDFYNGQCYVSLVAFMFEKVRVRGLSIPMHTDFPEINLRFYVRNRNSGVWKRGVVFIKEIVPKRAITLIANAFFGEHYVTLPAMFKRKQESGQLTVTCAWKSRVWSEVTVTAGENKQEISEGSKEEFIMHHSWGFTALSRARTAEYQVSHPAWSVYPVIYHGLRCDFGGLYGEAFHFLSNEKPASVFLAEGSPVTVYHKRIIR